MTIKVNKCYFLEMEPSWKFFEAPWWMQIFEKKKQKGKIELRSPNPLQKIWSTKGTS